MMFLVVIPMSYGLTLESGTIIHPNSSGNSGYYVLHDNVQVNELIVDEYVYISTVESGCTVQCVDYGTGVVLSDSVNATLSPVDNVVDLDINILCPGTGGGDIWIPGYDEPFRFITGRDRELFDFTDLPPILDDPIGWVIGMFAKGEILFVLISIILILLYRSLKRKRRSFVYKDMR